MGWTTRIPCRNCGGEKPAGPGRLYCDTCQAHREALKLCRGCGGEKRPGKGQHYCVECYVPRDEQTHVRGGYVRMSCAACGGEKPAGIGRRLCDECLELATWRHTHREAARARMERQPCEDCGGRKQSGAGLRYCEACRERRSMRLCFECHEPKIPLGSGHQRLCDDCKDSPERLERKRAYSREQKRLARLDPEKAERARASSRASHAKRRATVEGRRRDNEIQRMHHRLRAERAGRELKAVGSPNQDHGGQLPGAPLARAIDEIARREAVPNMWAPPVTHDNDTHTQLVAARAGTTARSVYAWRTGEREFVGLFLAVEILDRLDLFWWEVWTEETVPDPEQLSAVRMLMERTRSPGPKPDPRRQKVAA